MLPWGDNLTCACVRRYLAGTAGDWELLMGFVTWLIHLAFFYTLISLTALHIAALCNVILGK